MLEDDTPPHPQTTLDSTLFVSERQLSPIEVFIQLVIIHGVSFCFIFVSFITYVKAEHSTLAKPIVLKKKN